MSETPRPQTVEEATSALNVAEEPPAPTLTWTPIVLYVAWGLAGTTLALGYLLGQNWLLAFISLLVGALSILAEILGGNRYISGAGFAAVIVLTVTGVWGAVAPPWALIAAAAALIAWDTAHFRQRILSVGKVETPLRVERQHLRRLLVTVGFSTLVGGAALAVQVRYQFGALLLLSLIAVLGLSLTIGYLRRETD